MSKNKNRHQNKEEVYIADLPADEQEALVEAIAEPVQIEVLDSELAVEVEEVVEQVGHSDIDKYVQFYEQHKDEILKKIAKHEYVAQKHENYVQIVDRATYDLIAIRLD